MVKMQFPKALHQASVLDGDAGRWAKLSSTCSDYHQLLLSGLRFSVKAKQLLWLSFHGTREGHHREATRSMCHPRSAVIHHPTHAAWGQHDSAYAISSPFKTFFEHVRAPL